MLQRSTLVVALFLLPTLAQAQDAMIRDFRPADFEQILKEVLRKDFDKTQGKNGFEYDIKETPYYAMFNPTGKFLLFFVRANNQGLTPEQLNNWNRDAIYSRAYTSGNNLIFEVPLGFSAGTSREIVRAYYLAFEKEYEVFRKAAQGNQ
jgi:hypothetical protein